MEDAKKRWSVTFTKHIKQKRKVYQDGFLDLHISTNKVKLYDDCEKLLECRILKNDEVVSSGETLAFNSYFVDVGDAEGDFKHIRDSSFQGRCKKKPQPGSSSPSHKIIREFKKRELQKYGTPLTSPEKTKPKTIEWQVLYTTQLTQKAKKYHDGFLQLATSGSMGRQIMLFDETRKLIDSRFLRRDEVIKSGESIAFDGYLVEIGECEDNAESEMDLNAQGNNRNTVGKSKVMHGQQSYIKVDKYDGQEFKKIDEPGCGASQGSPDTTNSNITEWQVMYTTQVTQKAKKYHDGFLRLSITGSLQRQVMLYNDDRKLLNSRFLKKDEEIRSGESIAFNSHLVDIGDPQANHQFQMDLSNQGNNSNVVRETGIIHGHENCLTVDKSSAKGKPQHGACSRENADSTFSSTNKPLRNAIQILSILQKPKTPGSIDAGFTGNSVMGQPSSKMLDVLDVVLDVPGDSQLLEPHNGSYKNMDTSRSNEDTNNGNCPVLTSSNAKSTISGIQISKDSDIGNLDQSHLEGKSCTNLNDEACVVGLGPGDGEINSFERESKTDEFPSFDLGF